MAKQHSLLVKGITITVTKAGNDDFISLTDIARNKNAEEPKDVVKNWMRSRTTIEFLGLWKQINNPDFKGVEFDTFLFEPGRNSFTLSPSKWIEATNAKGLISKAGNNGGTYAHKDIAFEFTSWISPGFKLYLIKEFKRLKEEENDRLQLDWNLQRTLAKINYRIHTDAIKENIMPAQIIKHQAGIIYASEADVLNMALFGKTAAEWRTQNPKASGNIRDMASLEQLVVLSNLESINAMLLHQQVTQAERLIQLNKMAISQMKPLLQNNQLKKLK